MSNLQVQATTVAEWQTLVEEARLRCSTDLSEDLESYLVFLLMRFTGRPELASSVLALEFLNSVEASGQQKLSMLRDLGDKCLLYSGLFPGRAERRRVRISYFVELGQSAYTSLSEIQKQSISTLYYALAERFVSLMDVLLAMRDVTGAYEVLSPLQAEELWSDTDSQFAYQILKNTTQGDPLYSIAKNSDIVIH